MCGIIGYTGDEANTLDVLMTWLSGLKYRGYDSAGVALADSSLVIHKREVEVKALEEALPDGSVGGAAKSRTYPLEHPRSTLGCERSPTH